MKTYAVVFTVPERWYAAAIRKWTIIVEASDPITAAAEAVAAGLYKPAEIMDCSVIPVNHIADQVFANHNR